MKIEIEWRTHEDSRIGYLTKVVLWLLSCLLMPVWLIFWLIPHPHIWRKLTAIDYGGDDTFMIFSQRHWGGYTGCEKDECMLCGRTKYP